MPNEETPSAEIPLVAQNVHAKAWFVPNFIRDDSDRQYPLNMVTVETLDAQCRRFRAQAFAKAGFDDPWALDKDEYNKLRK